METESEKYKRVINILRESKPLLNSTQDIENEVIRKISTVRKTEVVLSDIIDFLFGWVYVGWIRRSLIAASVVLLVVFVWQQSIILKQINFLSRQTIVMDGESTSIPATEFEKKLLMYRLSGRRFPSRNITISEKQMNQLLDSVNELQIKYKDLIKLIEEDPELNKLIGQKLIKNSSAKIKL